MVQHQRRRQDRGDRAGDVLAGDIRRRAVDPLEHRDLARVDVARSRDPDAAYELRAEVRDDVAEQVGRDADVKPLGVLHHEHARRVDVGVVGVDAWILRCDLTERPRPQLLGANRVGLVDQRDLGLAAPARWAALLGQLKRVANDALGALAGVEHLLHRDLVGAALLRRAVDACVGVLGVLPAEHHVDVLGLLALQRTQRLVVELDRAQVDEQVELVAEASDDRELQLADLDARVSHSAEQHRVHVAQAVEGDVRHHLAGREEVLGAVGQVFALGLEAEDLLDRVEHLEGFVDDFGADAVAAEDREIVDGAHVEICAAAGPGSRSRPPDSGEARRDFGRNSMASADPRAKPNHRRRRTR